MPEKITVSRPAGGYEVVVSRGITPLEPSAYTAAVSGGVRDYRFSPDDKANIAKYLFGGLSRCLYDVEKFQSAPERVMASLLERDARNPGRQWCERATAFLTQPGGKPWTYALVPHDAVLLNSSLPTLVQRFGQ